MKKITTFLIFALLSGNICALEIQVKGDSAGFDKQEISSWFGWVEASRAYKGQYNETVIEFYCHAFKLVENNKPPNKENVIYVFPGTEDDTHFVATIRTPDMSIEKAKEFLTSMMPEQHICYYPKAIVSFEGKFADKTALFLAGDLIISNKYKVEVNK